MARGAILGALALVLAGGLYVRLRWRRSPQAYRAMIVLAASYFLAGALAGGWLMRLVMPPPSALPSPVAAPTLSLSIPTPLPTAQVSISASMFGWDPTRAVLPNPKLGFFAYRPEKVQSEF
jgi:hypothetical protein